MKLNTVSESCTCRNATRPTFPCPLHAYVYATKKERIELLEARVEALERLLAERGGT